MSVHVEDQGYVRLVTIDRPERSNALDPAMSEALGAAFATAIEDDAVRVVVLTGAGTRVFCAGMDLRSFREGVVARTPPGAPAPVGMQIFTESFYPKPIIAALNGAAVGGGMGMALACDLIVAADHVTFAIPEVQRGLIGVGVTSRAALRIPPAVVSELALTGEPIDAHRAFALGLINRVVPSEELLPTARALAERIAANGPLGVRASKRVIADASHLHDSFDLAALRRHGEAVMASDDAKEGAAAFLERRLPRFTGR